MMVYLAAKGPLTLLPWNENAPGFYVAEISPDEQRVKKQFSQPFVVYAGSHEGCGCGFQYGEYPDDSYEPGEREARRRTLHRFAEYLETEIARVGSIGVFSCWDGDQEEQPSHRRSLTPDDLRDPNFHFLERECSVVTRSTG